MQKSKPGKNTAIDDAMAVFGFYNSKRRNKGGIL
jgi:hypothetical protein